MQKLFLTLAIVLVSTTVLRSQNTSISGNALGAEGLKIRLIATSDYISELPKKIDETTIDSLGNFKLKTSINETFFAQLQIDIYKGDIYIEPGKSYSIKKLPLNFKEEDKMSPF